ncbi:hypothetical protein ACFO9E_17230 [Streptomyces maoxianensis]|uniref:Uncharacterized protein n=1 Tax=Streptomyces maoxianensis TaxID=1459942 RepID=A0ABV9G5F5_9ACTN
MKTGPGDVRSSPRRSVASIYRDLAEHEKARGVPGGRRGGPRRLRRSPGRRRLDNVEALAVTSHGPGGRLRLLLVGDDNQNASQIIRPTG